MIKFVKVTQSLSSITVICDCGNYKATRYTKKHMKGGIRNDGESN